MGTGKHASSQAAAWVGFCKAALRQARLRLQSIYFLVGRFPSAHAVCLVGVSDAGHTQHRQKPSWVLVCKILLAFCRHDLNTAYKSILVLGFSAWAEAIQAMRRDVLCRLGDTSAVVYPKARNRSL